MRPCRQREKARANRNRAIRKIRGMAFLHQQRTTLEQPLGHAFAVLFIRLTVKIVSDSV
jgi:hypothetical protein